MYLAQCPKHSSHSVIILSPFSLCVQFEILLIYIAMKYYRHFKGTLYIISIFPCCFKLYRHFNGCTIFHPVYKTIIYIIILCLQYLDCLQSSFLKNYVMNSFLHTQLSTFWIMILHTVVKTPLLHQTLNMQMVLWYILPRCCPDKLFFHFTVSLTMY